MVNKSTNIVDNICVWDGDTNTWQPPTDTLMLIQANTEALVWTLASDKTNWVLTEVLGAGDIGFIWDATTQILTTNQPKPASVTQPTTNLQTA